MSLNTPVHFLLWLIKLSTVMKDVTSEHEKSAQQHSWEKGGLDQRISSISLLDLRALHFFSMSVPNRLYMMSQIKLITEGN